MYSFKVELQYINTWNNKKFKNKKHLYFEQSSLMTDLDSICY